VLPDAGPAYDARTFGAFSLDACGVCLCRLGRFAEDAEAWGAAAAVGDGDPSYAPKETLARARSSVPPTRESHTSSPLGGE
jgi:hypothetical protein